MCRWAVANLMTRPQCGDALYHIFHPDRFFIFRYLIVIYLSPICSQLFEWNAKFRVLDFDAIAIRLSFRLDGVDVPPQVKQLIRRKAFCVTCLFG